MYQHGRKLRKKPDSGNTSGRGGQGNGFTSEFISLCEGRLLLEELKPRAAPSPAPAQSEWPDPDLGILRLSRRPPPVLPLSFLGDRWATWVENAAESASAPVDYVVAPLLASSSALIGHARWAQAWEGWTEPPHLWCAAVGDSGDGKSPGADAVYRYIVPSIERRMAADFPDRLREAQAAIEAAKARLESWKDLVRTAVKDGHALPPQPDPVPREPLAPRLVLSDVTIERVACVLASSAPKGLLMTRDELAGWLTGMTAYNDGARAFWLEAYGGAAVHR